MGVVGVFIPYIIYLLALRIAKSQSGLFVGALRTFIGDVLAAVSLALNWFIHVIFPVQCFIAITAMQPIML